MKCFATAACMLVIMGCSEVKEKAESNAKDKDSATQKQASYKPDGVQFPLRNKVNDTLLLESFEAAFTSIEGCSGFYKLSNCTSDSCNLIFASDLLGKAFINSDGKLITLKRVYKNVTPTKTKERYEGEGYTITIEVYPGKQTGDEVQEYNGELKVIKGDRKISEKIKGEVGC